jgi:hypothetical protein
MENGAGGLPGESFFNTAATLRKNLSMRTPTLRSSQRTSAKSGEGVFFTTKKIQRVFESQFACQNIRNEKQTSKTLLEEK